MNTKSKFTRFVFALLLALSALGISTSTALADKPIKYEFPFLVEGTLTDVCSFPVHISANVYITGIDFYDKSGVLTRTNWHMVEQDTFTANDKELVGIPFTFHVEWLYNSSGAVTHEYADGVTEKIPLPDGSLFISAGRVDFTAHPDVSFILSPDKGNPGNIEGFCAALAP
jgi:hypothetical protein